MQTALPRRNAIIVAAFIGLAMVLGGGGTPSPATEMLLQLMCVAAMLAWLWTADLRAEISAPAGMAPWFLTAIVLLVPLVQLVPLPPALWHSFPGQTGRLASLTLVGAAERWRPWSLSPPRTLASLLAIVPAAFSMLAVASLPSAGRRWVIRTIAAVALASAVVGAAQLSLGSSAPRLYAASNDGLTGFQANKNAEADVLLIGLVALAAALAPSLGRNSRSGERASARLIGSTRTAALVLAGAGLVLVLATVLTNSRMGIMLIPLALLGGWATAAPALGKGTRVRWLPFAVLLIVGVVALAALSETNGAVAGVFQRFGEHDDPRHELWRDAWFSLVHSWPAGIGMGGAQNAMLAAERLEIVDQSAPNRVHNDYLEFALEGGILALLALFAGVVLIARAAWGRWRERMDRAEVVLGLTILAIIACHSLVDYPLRSMAVACLAAVGAGLLFPRSVRTQSTAAPLREAAR